jgi:hypothetical protein
MSLHCRPALLKYKKLNASNLKMERDRPIVQSIWILNIVLYVLSKFGHPNLYNTMGNKKVTFSKKNLPGIKNNFFSKKDREKIRTDLSRPLQRYYSCCL